MNQSANNNSNQSRIQQNNFLSAPVHGETKKREDRDEETRELKLKYLYNTMQNIQSISNDIKISYHLELILIRLNTERAQSEPVKTRMFLKIFGKYAQDTS